MAPSDGPGPFIRPRVAGGLALVGLVIVLAISDAYSTDYAIDPITLGILLGAGLLLLGVDAGKGLIR